MGLFVEFDVVDDFGYLAETEEYGIVPDYSEGCKVFVETFLEIAEELVPVDTGYLSSTITAEDDDTYCYAETECDYAQYPEFGTWCQEAQPYFSPALEEAIEAAKPYWDEAEKEAIIEDYQLKQEELTSEIESATAGIEEGDGFYGGDGFDGDEEEYQDEYGYEDEDVEEDPDEIRMALGEGIGGGFNGIGGGFSVGSLLNLVASMFVGFATVTIQAMLGADFSSSEYKSNANVYIPEIIIT